MHISLADALSLGVPLTALALDMLLGDPQTAFHPVRLIGWVISQAQKRAPRGPWARFWYGAVCVILLSSIAAWIVHALPALLPQPFSFVFCAYLTYAGLALGDLLKQGRHVAGLIDTGRLDDARMALSMLVSRDTVGLDENDLRRGLAETISENLCDGFVAPFFYLCLGGLPLLWAYKVVSTFDSMWGYKHEPYRMLGRFGARADDVAAFLPARLTAVSVWLYGLARGQLKASSLRTIREQAKRMDSPNAGWPMAAMAWLLDAGMGGPTSYNGKIVSKPALGPSCVPWSAAKVRLLLKVSKKICLFISFFLLIFQMVSL